MDDKKEADILDSLEEEMFEDKEPDPTDDISALSDEIHAKMDELKKVLKPEDTKPKAADDTKIKKLAEEIRMKIPNVMDCTLIKPDGTLIASTMTDKDESGIFGRSTARLTKSAIRALTESSYGDCEHIILTGTENQIVVKSLGDYILATKLDKNTNIGMYLIKVKTFLKNHNIDA